MHRWLAVIGVLSFLAPSSMGSEVAGRIPIHVERSSVGAPLTFGLPFPKGVLRSPDHVRVVAPDGREIPSQVTEVTTWEPADPSIKWVWVFFFAESEDHYFVEYGDSVRPELPGVVMEIVNNQRADGLMEVTTGPLRFVVHRGEGGFMRKVQLDLDRNGFDDSDIIADGSQKRGSFVDILDEAGLDPSRASVRQMFIERGSGRLHAVLRVEGEYRYGRADNNPVPFVTRIHAYAGKPFVRVLHTFVYTGVPDKHRPQEGDYPHVATQAEKIVETDPSDEGWTIPEDRIAAAGLTLSLKLGGPGRALVGLREGKWWRDGAARTVAHALDAASPLSLLQLGPKPDRMPPVPESSPTERIGGFSARLASGENVLAETERAAGWMDVSDGTRGVAIGIRHFLEEYPKELRFDPGSGEAEALLWSPRAGPMSFARLSNRPARERAVENWAQGLAKTSELLFHFHPAEVTEEELARTMRYVLDPPVAHADPAWYGASGVYGRFAPRTSQLPELQRGLDYKFDWVLFNQRWVPWYGMFDHGDVKVSFSGDGWREWGHNEPAQDFILWLQFMRTGDARIFDAAQAMSRHTMDVDNTHWPTDPSYWGDTNYPLDYWRTLEQPRGSKWVGVGRRHSAQHWQHILSAHVWVQGWMADYYLAADHRGLDVAIQTAEMHLRRLWGEHELTGRRLYLSVWNLVDVWDATKDERYAEELRDRVGRMLRLQREQGGSLLVDRYGYAQIYVSHGLQRYLDMTGDAQVRAALIRHARWVRDVPPLNHWTESYLSSAHSLVLGYELTGEKSFLDEIRRRIPDWTTDALPRPVDDSWTQRELFDAIEAVHHLPADPGRHRPGLRRRAAPAPAATASPRRRRPGWSPTNGLRVFGWTHAFSLPYALEVLTRQAPPTGEEAHRPSR